MFKKLAKKAEREFNRVVEPNLHEKLKGTHQSVEGRQATIEASLASLEAIIKELQSEIPSLEQSYQAVNESAHSQEEKLTLLNARQLLQDLKSLVDSLVVDRQTIQAHQKTINEKSQTIKEIRNNGTPDKNTIASEEARGNNLANEVHQIYQANIESIIQAYQGKITKITEARNDLKLTLAAFERLKAVNTQKQVLGNLRAVLETRTNSLEEIESKIKQFHEVMNALEQNKVNIDAPFADNQTIMHIAAQQPYHVEIFKTLLKMKPDLSLEDNQGWTPIHYAAKSEHPMSYFALTHFANHPHIKEHPEWFTKASARHNDARLSPLEIARAFNQKEAEKQILAVISPAPQVENNGATQSNVSAPLVNQAASLMASLSTKQKSNVVEGQATLLPQFQASGNSAATSSDAALTNTVVAQDKPADSLKL